MKNFLTILLLLVSFLSFSQWTDDFTDGDFTNNPTWSGQNANFEIDLLNQLHLNAPSVTDTSYLSLPSTAMLNATWEFYVKMDFGTSGSNMCRVYMASNNTNLKSSLNGYFVLIGNTSDEVSLYRQDGVSKTKIIDGINGLVGSNPVVVKVKVTRDALGNWELFADNTGGTNFVSQGTIFDNTYLSSTFAGVHCKYTSTRSNKFYFDDFVITGSPYVDNTLPSVISVTATSSNTVDVLFSEDMQQTSVENINNYNLDNGFLNPLSATHDATNKALVHLSFASNFINNTSYFLTTTNVNDLALNTLVNSVDNFIYFVSEVSNPDDVLITEFMADYLPVVGLPEEEYVEIYNTSSKYFDLVGWTIGDASSNTVLGNYILGPNEYVLITHVGASNLFGISNTIEVNLPLLNNSGDAIVLKNDLGYVIDSINYDITWYNNSSKDGGGWAIERKRLSNQCTDKYNWAASIASTGGTPGVQNSIYTTLADISAPIVKKVTVIGDSALIFQFDEYVFLQSNFNLTITPLLNVLASQTFPVNSIKVKVDQMQPNVIYTGIISNTANCWGTTQKMYTFKFGLASTAQNGDVIINEILFNPLTGGSDYVEIVNISNKIIDLKDWKTASIDNGSMGNINTITNQQTLVFPNDYIVLTEDSTDVINDFSVYGVGTFLETDLPTYPNDSATVIIINDNTLVIDQVHYDEDYHFKLLTNNDGKSLERLSFNAPSNAIDNWHTAAEIVDWGTPGYKNSQQITNETSGVLTLNQPIFSPDNDGYQDVMTINYEFSNPDNVLDVQIFDSEGRLIKELKDNFYPGTNGILVWDGLNESNTKAQVGTYVVLITVFDLEGNRSVYKKVVVLASKL